MALSKPTTTFFTHLKTLAKPHHHHPPSFLSLRLLSFATPEDAAADRRQRKRRLRMEPPVSALRHNQQQQHRRPPHSPIPNPNPNAPKLSEHVSVLTGKRLDLHNRILTLIRQNDLEEAALLTRHSIYSNCKPTIFTCNSVMAALLRQSKYSDLLSLHRFITQAGVAPNVITHNLIINVYCDCRKTDTALEHYKQLINNAPFNPSPTTYRILVKGLVDNGKVERAVELKDEMHEKGFVPDPLIYGYLMSGLVKKEDSESADGVLALYDELQSKSGGFVSDGVVSGSLMKAYFRKGMEKEAMECYEEALSILNNSDASKSYSDSSVGVKRMGAVAYNWVLDALIKNGKFDNALQLFDKMMERHEPPRRLTVNLGSFNVMVDWFCAQGKFQEAIEVFRKMGEKRCSADTLSYNNLIQQLCENGMVAEAEELYQDLVSHDQVGPKPDEFTYVLLMDACFGQNRADDAAGYFTKMVDPSSGLKPNLVAYKKVVDGLIKAGKIDEAKGFFDQMAEKLNLEAADYEVMLRALCDAEGKLDEVLKMIDAMLDDETLGGLTSEMNEFVTDALRKEGREEELGRLVEEKERKKKAEALAKKKAEEEKAAAANNVTATVSSARTLAMLSGASGVNGNVAVSESILGSGGNVSSADQQVVGEAPGLVDTGVVDEATKADDLAEQPKNVDDGVA